MQTLRPSIDSNSRPASLSSPVMLTH
uniref:Uncharacterized protein n=1 Tax=Rhizophora mucronata TaxID=61149 RepID=A0A2P2NRN8_RHIMU